MSIPNSDLDLRAACAEILLNLSAQGKTASLWDVLLFLTIIAEFRPLIQPVIPGILNFYKQSHYDSGFSQLWDQGITSIYQVYFCL
jgi:hypothetical protein